jgi:hypothetical protein
VVNGGFPIAKSHAPATPSAVIEAIHALLDSLGSGVEDDVAVSALAVPSVTSG